MKPKALIVEDDDRIIDTIEDTLFSIGHEHDRVTNQYDAQELLKSSPSRSPTRAAPWPA